TVVMWDRKTSKPIYNAIVWQCRRTTEFCQNLRKRKLEPLTRNKTGLVIDPYFSASKLNWILKNVPQAKARATEGEHAAGTIDTYLMWRLSGGQSHSTDVSNASRTQLMNITTGKWDKQLLQTCQGPESVLPQVTPA